MGWKCPDCGGHNYGSHCRYCNPQRCMVCKHRINDKHHVTYPSDDQPLITLWLCRGCHDRIHHEPGFLDRLNPLVGRTGHIDQSEPAEAR